VAWIESHTTLRTNAKLVALAVGLRMKPVHVMGHLHALWHTALDQRPDGDFSSWTDDRIAAAADYSAGAPQFVQQLQTHVWLGYRNATGKLIPGTERLIHDWLDYVGTYLQHSKFKRRPELWEEVKRLHRWASMDSPQTVDGLSARVGGGPGQGEVPKSAKGVEIPQTLRAREFLDAWGLWEEHLRKKRVRTTDVADRQQLAECEAWGVAASVANIHFSISKNYQGLFQAKTNGNGAAHSSARVTDDTWIDRLNL
jgi:hypothetical protein